MKLTELLGLKKPEGSDYYDIENHNDNSDLIDAKFKEQDGKFDQLDTLYSDIDHTHEGVYEPVIAKKSGFNLDKSDLVTSTSSTLLATAKAVKVAYDKALEALNVANSKSASNHNHAGVYEPVISKLSGFNLNKSDSVSSASSSTIATSSAVKTAYDRGTAALNSANTKAEANHNHAGVYEPVISKATGFNLNKTDSVTSTSSSHLATARAVKTAYDRGSAGINAAGAITNYLGVASSGTTLKAGRFTVGGHKQPMIILSTAAPNVSQMSDGDVWIQYQA